MLPSNFLKFVQGYGGDQRYLPAAILVPALRELGENKLADIVSIQQVQIWDILHWAETAAALFPDEVIIPTAVYEPLRYPDVPTQEGT